MKIPEAITMEILTEDLTETAEDEEITEEEDFLKGAKEETMAIFKMIDKGFILQEIILMRNLDLLIEIKVVIIMDITQ